MIDQNKFYVTTPIYYATAKPHLGSLYSTLIADVIARWQTLQGKEVFFLTGTDEHGQKIAQAAMAAQKDPQMFINSFISSYKDAWHLYGIGYSKFIRTTDTEHKKGVAYAIKQLIDSGAIYKAIYEGWYCTPCETFVTGKDLENSAAGPLCPTCNRVTVFLSEQTYFFRLSAYQDRLLAFYNEHPEFIVPTERMNEVKSFVNSGINDLSISRTTISWGIPFPNDPEHVVYVWVDALLNYLTGIGYGDSHQIRQFAQWWQPDVQVLGKDIIRFHAVYWPAILMALDLPLPKQLLVHGWIKVDKEKMSKSRGNIVDPIHLFNKYGADPVRYYLLRQLAINQDGEFSIDDLEQRISSDLANDLGNLLQRMTALAVKHDLTQLSSPATWGAAALELQDHGWDLMEEIQILMSGYAFHMMLASVWKFIHQLNSYFHTQEPWKLIKKDKEAVAEILCATAHGLRIVGIVLSPFMPEKMVQLLHSLGHSFKAGHDYIAELDSSRWHCTFTITTSDPLFVKPEPKVKEKVTTVSTVTQEDYITIDDLGKVELSIGTIMTCNEVSESEKLLRLKVDFGKKGTRQVLAGIRKSYRPEDLVGKQAVFVTNLKPRVMVGYESQGMLFVAHDDQEQPHIIMPDKPVINGTRLK